MLPALVLSSTSLAACGDKSAIALGTAAILFRFLVQFSNYLA